MARTKGMLNLSGNLEVNAQAPLDARTIVPTEADLTVASNFPYPYVGLEVYVTGTGKKFRLTNLDTTQSSSWHEVGEGGGGQTYNDFTGATASTAGAHGLVPAPSAGDEGKVLFGNGLWGALPSVDLSVLSNEAFQFSPNEKPVGTWTDSNNVTKILYAKTVDCGALTNAGEKSVSTGLSNVIIRNIFGRSKSSAYDIPLPYPDVYIYYGYSDNKIYIRNDTDRSSYTSTDATLFYTKTTDSPLPSDVKFAGVTSSGEVILEKTVHLNSAVQDTEVTINNMGVLIKYSGTFELSSGNQFVMPYAYDGREDVSLYVRGSDKKIIINSNLPTLLNLNIDFYYTLAS
jgi:hypothetical protein